jgi:hypothetical protein
MKGGIMFPFGSPANFRTLFRNGFLLVGALLLFCAPALALRAVIPSEQTGLRSDHITMEFGMGGTDTAGNTSESVTAPGFDLLAGVGYRLNEYLSIPFEYNFSIHGVQNVVLQQAGEPNGYFYFNSFAINPTFTFLEGPYWGAYIAGGGGFSNKDVSFGYDTYNNSNCGSARRNGGGVHSEYSGCPAFQSIASNASNQPMLDLGGGITLRFHQCGRGRLFLEARYVKMYTPAGTFPGYAFAGTQLIPVTFGIRF